MLSFLKKRKSETDRHTRSKKETCPITTTIAKQTNYTDIEKKKNKTKTELQSAPVYLFARVCFHQMDGIGNYTIRRMFKMLRFRTC